MLGDFELELRRLHQSGSNQFAEDWITKLKERRINFEAAYKTLDKQNREPISYSSICAQTAYIFAYAPVRAAYTFTFLQRHRAALEQVFFDKEEIQVCSFGGGPASELVGLVRYLEDAGEPVQRIRYRVYDKDGEWEEIARNIVAALASEIMIDIDYFPVDVSSKEAMAAVDLSTTDLLMFSYVMSELAKIETAGQISKNFQQIISLMPKNSKIFFQDNLHPIFIRYFESCLHKTSFRQFNDNGDTVDFAFPDNPEIFEIISNNTEWNPRTELKSVSKFFIRKTP